MRKTVRESTLKADLLAHSSSILKFASVNQGVLKIHSVLEEPKATEIQQLPKPAGSKSSWQYRPQEQTKDPHSGSTNHFDSDFPPKGPLIFNLSSYFY